MTPFWVGQHVASEILLSNILSAGKSLAAILISTLCSRSGRATRTSVPGLSTPVLEKSLNTNPLIAWETLQRSSRQRVQIQETANLNNTGDDRLRLQINRAC
jgi:hypothetical protein